MLKDRGMLKLYGNRISVNVRRVWVALLEKQIPFELITLQLDGDQLEPEFTQINPLQRVPVLADEDFQVVESLAILDYLEAKYPLPSLLPADPKEIATVRMVEFVAVNELQPATLPLTKQLLGLETSATQLATARQRIPAILKLYEQLLGSHAYFAEERFTLAEVVAGTLLPSLPMLGFALESYPQLNIWLQHLTERESWQKTTPSAIEIQLAIPTIKKILERRV